MSIIAYVRVSKDEQTVDNQLVELRGLYAIDKVFSDEGVSGSSKATSRDGFTACLNYLRDGDTLVVVAIDRLGRNTIDVLETVEALKSKGVRVVSKREGFDLSTDAGRMVLAVLAAVGQLERDNLIQRTKAGVARAKAEGKHCGRPKANIDAIQDCKARGLSQSATAAELSIGIATVKRHWNI